MKEVKFFKEGDEWFLSEEGGGKAGDREKAYEPSKGPENTAKRAGQTGCRVDIKKDLKEPPYL